ncbi:hypothetical protein PAESOLCIP111_01832 [Paenibacillus solanacearum]|uniref:NlpC/P60 domain-containing protein n=2 Tax=Paenibacillus solanacearum TaxID=2048548 RepID=A0A916JYD6_9BACL|nr:hypothetical protein PAESOLCIP111_01832 [Paenibacillus solanacearum]
MMLKQKFVKQAVTVGLSLSLLFTGAMVIHPGAAQAKSQVDKIIDTGDDFMGVRYKFGAPSGSDKVFDCSSFMQYIFKEHGVKLPRESRDQAKKGKHVSRSNLKKGDLVFFSTRKSGKGKIGHVGVYIGNGKILHTYGKPGVTISTIKSGWWDDHYITARRVL